MSLQYVLIFYSHPFSGKPKNGYNNYSETYQGFCMILFSKNFTATLTWEKIDTYAISSTLEVRKIEGQVHAYLHNKGLHCPLQLSV